jgi:hypothetical protein
MHAVDFGAGGVSSIGPLTAHNLDGHGLCVIAIRDEARVMPSSIQCAALRWNSCGLRDGHRHFKIR